MTIQKITEKLYKDIHSVCIGSIDADGRPVAAIFDILKADETGIYFSTHTTKKIYQALNLTSYVSLTGMCGEDFFHSQMVTFQGRIENLGGDLLKELLEVNPYLYQLFPIGRDNSDLEVFRIFDGKGEYQDFSVTPNIRCAFSIQ